MPSPPMRTETAVRPRFAARTRETEPDRVSAAEGAAEGGADGLDSESEPESSEDEGSSSESESEYEDENGNMVKKEKEPGTVDEDKMPPIWDQVTERVLGEFEKMTLKIEPMTDDQCWEDATAQKEENERVADALGRGKRAKPDPTESPPESPPPPGGGQQRSRKSKRIIAKVNRGGQMQSYKHLSSGRHLYMGT